MQKLHFKYTLKTALLLFIPIALLIVGFSVLIYEYQLREEKSRITEVTKVQVNALRNSLDTELSTIQEDLDYITEHQALLKYFQFTNFKRYSELQTYWVKLAEKRRYYDQIQFIDNHGREVLKISQLKGKMAAIPKQQLKNRSSYSYFRKSQNLEKGDTFISQFELSLENGQVEHPYKPVIRFIRPVFDSDNNRKGVVVVTYLGQHLLKILNVYEKMTQGQLLLLNNQGYYLKGLTAEMEWGFMFQQSQAKTFARAYPSAWKEILKLNRGQFENRIGLFTFEKIEFPSTPTNGKRKYYRQWLLINLIHSSEFKNKVSSLFEVISYVTYGMLLGLAIIVLFWSSIRTQKKQTQLELEESEQRSALILESVTEGIYGVDINGIIIFINPSACKILGYSQNELIGKSPWDTFYKNKEKNNCLAFMSMQESKVFHSTDVTFISKQGQEIPVEYCASPIEIEGKIEEAVITFKDISQRKASEQELTKKATTDALTGSYNRHKFEQMIDQEISNMRGYQNGLSIAILDIDHFKKINDTYGHDVGDTTLVTLAVILMENLRSSDALIRWGGEEFVVICPDTNEEGIFYLADKLRRVVSQTEFETIGNLTISIGIGEYYKDETQEEFFNRIDKALYDAKHSGRNCVKRAPHQKQLDLQTAS